MLMVQATSVTDITANSFLSSVSDEGNKYFDTGDCFIIIASISPDLFCSRGCLVDAMTQSILTLSRDNYSVMLKAVNECHYDECRNTKCHYDELCYYRCYSALCRVMTLEDVA